MSRLTTFAQILSIAAFAWYGAQCLLSTTMIDEFNRYGLPRFRLLTGTLQLAGSVGLLVGFAFRPLIVLSSAGLAAMMLGAFIVRLRIRDSLHLAIPSLVFFALNLFILVSTLGLVG